MNIENTTIESAEWVIRRARALGRRCAGRKATTRERAEATELAGRIKVVRRQLEIYCD